VPTVRIRDNESFEAALRRFKKSIEKEGVLSEVKKRSIREAERQEKKK
jgi:small subunit ribosomal protein S21